MIKRFQKQHWRMILWPMILLFFLANCELFSVPIENELDRIESVEELESAANGLVALLKETVSSSQYFYLNRNANDLTHGVWSYNEYYQLLMNFNCFKQDQFGTAEYDYTWESMYRIITSANNIFYKVNVERETDQEYRAILGEVAMIRAYAYFRLTRTYGRIPIVKDVDVSFNVGLSSYDEVYQAIVDDLALAFQLLPESLEQSRIPYETPHRGMAKAVLAEVYLSWAGYPANNIDKYELATSTAREMIDSAAVYGMGLMDDFAQLWDQEHRMNKESVYTLYYTPVDQIDELANLQVAYNSGKNSYYRGEALFDYTSEYGLTTFRVLIMNGLTVSPDLLLMPHAFWGCQMKFYNDYPASYRKDITFFNKPYFPDLDGLYADTGYVYIDKVSSACIRLVYRKFFYDPYYDTRNATLENMGSEKDLFGDQKIYLFRYAQTLLTYAEASARSGQLNDFSYECLNKVRRRAHHVDLNSSSEFDLQAGLSAQAFADSVVQERLLEMAAETESGWFDLLRLGRIPDLPSMREKGEGTFMDLAPDFFLPKPASDILLNPNLADGE
ncbi:MAG: RagB/SusD family nutrient uptake outer membrane protein [Prolixibacteraceae bacterium]